MQGIFQIIVQGKEGLRILLPGRKDIRLVPDFEVPLSQFCGTVSLQQVMYKNSNNLPPEVKIKGNVP
ncbi:hypothetical protein ES708_26766 [subsurface metagenome]